MSSNPRLPPELCDRIIDQLRDRPKALRVCSVVSKSWTSRSRKHIFSTVSFNGDRDIVAWGNAFPDPSNSPAHHARQLVVSYRGEFPENHLVSFCNVTCLLLHVHAFNGRTTSLTQLHGFTPLLKSLTMSFHVLPFTDVLSLVYSFPLLDDLTLIGLPTASDTKITSPVSPMFSGKLYLAVVQAMGTVVDDLLSLPSGIHFRELIMHWMCEEDLPSMMDLISACSRTLEDLQILNHAKRTCSWSLPRLSGSSLSVDRRKHRRFAGPLLRDQPQIHRCSLRDVEFQRRLDHSCG